MDRLDSVMKRFGLDGASAAPFGTGLIHETWLIETNEGPFLLQRLNDRVFADPAAVAENAAGVALRVDMALTARCSSAPLTPHVSLARARRTRLATRAIRSG